ncbi:TPA: hypothetical protein ACT5B2_002200 [Burkholderia cenocepacia]|uniref:hypothetical protein n=1 Tax=Burkholderia cenocepacia TaxID=95486 RepID=UPI00286F0123|nr:hypothetical protein [Burkholderia cenocepacia]MEB2544226.1 hypothetical protein [Burkholderia cenocepacia]
MALVAVIAAVGAKVVGPSTDSYLANWEKVAAEVGAATTEDQADLDKKYAVEVNVRLVKLVGMGEMKGVSAKTGSNVQSVLADDGMTSGPGELFLKSDDGKVNLLVTTVPLLKVWDKSANMGLKSKDDVAVIFDSETFYTDVFADDAAAFRFAELPVKRNPAEAVVKALLLRESQGGVPEGANTLAVSVKQGGKGHVLWREMKVAEIAACGMGRVDEETRDECFAKRLPVQRRYSQLVSEAQGMLKDVVQ